MTWSAGGIVSKCWALLNLCCHTSCGQLMNVHIFITKAVSWALLKKRVLLSRFCAIFFASQYICSHAGKTTLLKILGYKHMVGVGGRDDFGVLNVQLFVIHRSCAVVTFHNLGAEPFWFSCKFPQCFLAVNIRNGSWLHTVSDSFMTCLHEGTLLCKWDFATWIFFLLVDNRLGIRGRPRLEFLSGPVVSGFGLG